MLALVKVVDSDGPVETEADHNLPLTLFWQLGGLYVFKRTPPPPAVIGCEFSLDKGSGWLGKLAIVDVPPTEVGGTIREARDVSWQEGLPVFSREPFELTISGDPTRNAVFDFGDHRTIKNDDWVYFRFSDQEISQWVVNTFVRFGFDANDELVGVRVERDRIPGGIFAKVLGA